MALRLSALVLTLALLAELVCAILYSPRLQVRQVRLVGVRNLDPGVVLARAEVKPGIALAAVPARAIRRRLEATPAVEWARVRRDWPATVVLAIRERRPAAFVRCGRGNLFVDRSGVAFSGVRCSTEGLPQLKGVRVNLGDLAQLRRDPRLRAALAALCAAQEASFAVREVAVHSPHNVALRLLDGTEVLLGRPERLRLKVSQAKVALAQLQPLHEVEYLDVSCPDAVVWKPRLSL